MTDSFDDNVTPFPRPDPPPGDGDEAGIDPEIAALLEFEPVPRKFKREDGWAPALQREFIRRLARSGSPTKACMEMGKCRHGIDKLYKNPEGASFRAAWDQAVELAARRKVERMRSERDGVAGLTAPFVDHRRRSPSPRPSPFEGEGAGAGGEGQVRNEYDEWEDEDSLAERAEAARDSICRKLLDCRRLYLQQISGCPGKRAAFEMLTERPIDWDKAARLEPQADEPYAPPNLRGPDMVLTAENGWLGEFGYGPDRKAELRRIIDQWRAEQGLPPIAWGGEDR